MQGSHKLVGMWGWVPSPCVGPMSGLLGLLGWESAKSLFAVKLSHLIFLVHCLFIDAVMHHVFVIFCNSVCNSVCHLSSAHQADNLDMFNNNFPYRRTGKGLRVIFPEARDWCLEAFNRTVKTSIKNKNRILEYSSCLDFIMFYNVLFVFLQSSGFIRPRPLQYIAAGDCTKQTVLQGHRCNNLWPCHAYL